MFELLAICLPTIAYTAGTLKCFRHLGWYARHKKSSCLCYGYNHHYSNSKNCYGRCRYCNNRCLASGIVDYGWSFLLSAVFWWGMSIGWGVKAVSNKYGLTELETGFFKPSPMVESKSEKIERLQIEAKQREAKIRSLEIEAGLSPTVNVNS